MGNSRAARGRVVEARELPVVVLVRDDIARLREAFDGRRLAVARSIYLALVERIGAGDSECTRGELADDAGVTKKTLDDYVPAFEAAGVLVVERRRDGAVNLPNVWKLVGGAAARATVRECVYCGADPDTLDHVVAGAGNRGNLVPACRSCNGSKQDRDVREWIELGGRRPWGEVAAALAAWGVRSVPGVIDHPEHPSAQSSDLNGVVKPDGGGPATLPLSGADVPEPLVADAVELLRRKTKVDGRIVTPVEMAIAAGAVAEINRQAESEFGLGAHLRAVVMRIRERPSYDADAHVRLVQSAWRIRWWEKGGRGRRPTPAVIYGNAGVFEQVVQDAVDEKRGRAIEGPATPAKRFTRED